MKTRGEAGGSFFSLQKRPSVAPGGARPSCLRGGGWIAAGRGWQKERGGWCCRLKNLWIFGGKPGGFFCDCHGNGGLVCTRHSARGLARAGVLCRCCDSVHGVVHTGML